VRTPAFRESRRNCGHHFEAAFDPIWKWRHPVFDHPVSADQERLRDGEADRFGRLRIANRTR
jgi:hypothetical protein